MTGKPGFFERLSLALRVLTDADLASHVLTTSTAPALGERGSPTLHLAPPAPAEKVVEKIVEVERIVERVIEKNNPEVGALHMLSILQRDGRLVDFLLEDISGAGDADVGAGARVVHSGCRKALQQYFTFEPIRTEPEGAAVQVEKGFDPGQIRLAGHIAGEPPYRGRLAHGGWRATDVRLPDRTAVVDARIVAPAEVEI